MTSVSVIIPAYNSASYIEGSVRAAMGQTVTDIEIIVIDDGSTDDTRSIASALASKDRRVRVVSNKHQGVEVARNLGAETARGKWVAFLDADDLWDRAKLEFQLRYLEAHPDLAAVSSFGRYFSGSYVFFGVIEIGPVTAEEYERLRQERKPMWMLTPSVVCRRSALLELGGFDPSFRGAGEDLDLWTRLGEQHPIRAMNQHLVYVRISGKSASMEKFSAIQMNTLRVRINAELRGIGSAALTAEEFQAFVSAIDRETLTRWARNWRGGFHYRQAGYSYLEGRYLACIMSVLKSLLLAPRPVFRKLNSQVFPGIKDHITRRWGNGA